ncbi:MAG: type II restriction endonuclease [Janthinobacterium svalbardensis]
MSVRPINFRASCVKTLSAVEVEKTRSNQHEFNGVLQLKNLFGDEKIQMIVSFSTRGRNDICTSGLTWYDAREAHATRSEYRLYFQSNPVMESAKEGDNIVIGFDLQGNIHCELIIQGAPGYAATSGWVTNSAP